MASLIPEYEYDIFISYRQKDNKGERWVSEFVSALETELESTFKEDISVYFDINPHDGLLETYDVDASLKRKLKCLVFIPVISRTYCDPKSFAWENEFKAFVKQASDDQFGLKITLPNGNVVSRVLPVRIHDLDLTDMKLCESVLGSMLRGVDFVYKSTGVNRPLMPKEEHPHDNLNKTYYRDQINKVANSIRDIIQVLNNSRQKVENVAEKTDFRDLSSDRKILSKNMQRGIFLILFILICSAGIYTYTQIHHRNNAEKTLAIIPLTTQLNEDELDSYAIGSMDAIISKLQDIKSLTVRGFLTSYYYLDTKKTIAELRKELNVNYLVFISISGTDTDTKMRIILTETRYEKELWSNQYDFKLDQLMTTFTKTAQTIAGNLDINLTNEEITSIEEDITNNSDAYLNYLLASAGLISAMGKELPDSAGFRSAIDYYDKAIETDPDFAIAYARRAIALSWGINTGELDGSNIDKCLSDINNASRINKDLTDIQIAYGFYYYYCTREYAKALISFNNAHTKDPKNYKPLFYMAMVYRAIGDWDKVHELIGKVNKFNVQDPLDLTNIGLCFEYLHILDSALIYHEKAIEVRPDWSAAYKNKFYTLLLLGKTPEARTLLDFISKNPDENIEDQILIDLYEKKDHEAFIKTLNAKPDNFSTKDSRNMYLGNISVLLHDKMNASKYYSLALDEYKLQLQTDTGNAKLHGSVGLALAGKGDKEAILEGEKAIRITVRNNNKILEREMILYLAEIYTKLGMYEKAIELIEDSLRNPSLFSTKMLQMDPVWNPLLLSPDIKKIIAKYDNLNILKKQANQ